MSAGMSLVGTSRVGRSSVGELITPSVHGMLKCSGGADDGDCVRVTVTVDGTGHSSGTLP